MDAYGIHSTGAACHIPEMTTEFWDRLTTAFSEAGYETSQSAIARRLEIGQSAVAKWAHGAGLPTLRKCIQIAKMTGVNVEWLVLGRGPKGQSGGEVDVVTEEILQRLSELSAASKKEVLAFIAFKSRVADEPPEPPVKRPKTTTQ